MRARYEMKRYEMEKERCVMHGGRFLGRRNTKIPTRCIIWTWLYALYILNRMMILSYYLCCRRNCLLTSATIIVYSLNVQCTQYCPAFSVRHKPLSSVLDFSQVYCVCNAVLYHYPSTNWFRQWENGDVREPANNTDCFQCCANIPERITS